MKKQIMFGVITLLTISGCFLPIDKSKQGANPLKNGGYCFWYYDEKDDHYCAYGKNFPPKEDLKYQKCDSCESYIRKMFHDANPK